MYGSLRKVFIAIEAVIYIAHQNGGDPVRSKDICEYQGVSLRYLEQILQSLVHDGILKSIRGPKGGYVLSRDRRKIRLVEIYKTVASSDKQAPSLSGSALNRHVIASVAKEAEESLANFFSSKTVRDLCDEASRHNIVIKPDERFDFVI